MPRQCHSFEQRSTDGAAASAVDRALDAGADFPILGRVAILHHDYSNLVQADADFTPVRPPVTGQHLADEGLSEAVIEYMNRWPGFVED